MWRFLPLFAAREHEPHAVGFGRSSVSMEGAHYRVLHTQSGCANGGGLLKGEKESRDDANARVAATLAKAHEAPAHDPRAGDDPTQRAALRPRLHTRHHRVPDAETSASSSLSLGNKW